MRGDDTRLRILDAAERSFAAQGFAATSLRDLAGAAAVNVAAVNYHFGSKEALLGAVIRRTLQPVSVERATRLDELEGSPSTVEELLDAFVAPVLALFATDQGATRALLIGRVLSDPGPEMQRALLSEVGTVEDRYLAALGRTLPELPEDELLWRFRSLIGVMVIHQLRPGFLDAVGQAPDVAPEPDRERARLVSFLAAAFRAPVPRPPGEEPAPAGRHPRGPDRSTAARRPSAVSPSRSAGAGRHAAGSGPRAGG